jgi:hypothetical protein
MRTSINTIEDYERVTKEVLTCVMGGGEYATRISAYKVHRYINAKENLSDITNKYGKENKFAKQAAEEVVKALSDLKDDLDELKFRAKYPLSRRRGR